MKLAIGLALLTCEEAYISTGWRCRHPAKYALLYHGSGSFMGLCGVHARGSFAASDATRTLFVLDEHPNIVAAMVKAKRRPS